MSRICLLRDGFAKINRAISFEALIKPIYASSSCHMKLHSTKNVLFRPFSLSTKMSQNGRQNEENQHKKRNFTAVIGISAVILGVAAYVVNKSYPDTKIGAEANNITVIKTNEKVDDQDDLDFSTFEIQKPELVELPKEVQYLIVGAGTAAFAAYRAIRAADVKAKVLLVSDDNQFPYMRPPLSKELWYSDDHDLVQQLKFKQWNGKERSLFYEKEGFYCKPIELPDKEFGGVAVALGQKVLRLDVKERRAFLNNGDTILYEKCLLATGGKPKNLSIIENAGSEVLARCTLFRNVDDFRKLQRVMQVAKSVAVVGGGFLGSELACCLGKRGKETGTKVVQTFPEKGNMGLILPEYLSKWATEKVRQEGVDVLPETSVTACKYDHTSRKVILELSDGSHVSVDHVVVSVGLKPNTDIAATSGLETDPIHGGFLVNAELEARSNVWVAGDAACFYDTHLGRRRVEHHDHAVVSGRLAGENMTGARRPYWHQSMFWSDLGPDVGYEAIGLVDSSLPTVAIFAKVSSQDTPRAVVEATDENLRSETEKDTDGVSIENNDQKQQPTSNESPDDFGKGIVFYLRDNVIVGIVLWNVFNRMAVARQVINDAKIYSDFAEVAKLFNLYGEHVVENTTETEAEVDLQ